MRPYTSWVLATVILLWAVAPGATAQPTSPAAMSAPRWLHSATLLPSGKVLVAGGENDFTYFGGSEIYDPATNTWTSAASPARERHVHAETLLPNGKVLVVGGIDSSLQTLSSAELYDPVGNVWSSAASLPAPRFGLTATLLPNGKVLVVGGNETLDNTDVVATVYLYDPTANAWSSVANLKTARSRHTATLLANGNVLVVGGSSGTTALASGELYDPAANTWNGVANLGQARQRHVATLLPSGKVLVVAGIDSGGTPFDGGNVLASAELYESSVNAWTSAASLTTGRHRPSATLLTNGAVLVMGGSDPLGNVLAGGEFYTAATTPPAEVVEYYNVTLDHYFITWIAAEIAILDAGTTIKGWQRTGYAFKAYTIAHGITTPICRYYLPPEFGNSHFFGRGTTECNATGQNNPGFILEDPAYMQMFLPVAGNCPALTTPIYRVFSNRSDANHRYMTDRAVRDLMQTRGWVAEGDGPDLVVMCAPQ